MSILEHITYFSYLILLYRFLFPPSSIPPCLPLQGFTSSKDCLILLVECTRDMFTASTDGTVPFELCMKVHVSPQPVQQLPHS